MRNRKIFVKILSLILCLLTAFFAISSTAFVKAADTAQILTIVYETTGISPDKVSIINKA